MWPMSAKAAAVEVAVEVEVRQERCRKHRWEGRETRSSFVKHSYIVMHARMEGGRLCFRGSSL